MGGNRKRNGKTCSALSWRRRDGGLKWWDWNWQFFFTRSAHFSSSCKRVQPRLLQRRYPDGRLGGRGELHRLKPRTIFAPWAYNQPKREQRQQASCAARHTSLFLFLFFLLPTCYDWEVFTGAPFSKSCVRSSSWLLMFHMDLLHWEDRGYTRSRNHLYHFFYYYFSLVYFLFLTKVRISKL